jgi:hypothetical protein
LALLPLLPKGQIHLPFGDVKSGFDIWLGYDTAACLLALSVGHTLTRSIPQLTNYNPVRPAWRPVVIVALVLWAIAFMSDSGGKAFFGGDVMRLTGYPLTWPAAFMLLLAIDWYRVAAWLRGSGIPSPRPWVLLVAVSTVLGLSLRVQLIHEHASLSLGSTSGSLVIAAGCFLAATAGWVSWKRIALIVGGCSVTAYALSHWLHPYDPSYRPSINYNYPFVVLTYGVCAAIIGHLFSEFWTQGGFDEKTTVRRIIGIVVILIALLVVVPLANRGSPDLSASPALWLLASISFMVGFEWRIKGMIAAPLVVQAGILLSGNVLSNLHAVFDVGAITLPYAMFGMLASKAGARKGTAKSRSQTSWVDISSVAALVQRIDNSTTLRAFGALLAPVIVLFHLSGVYQLDFISVVISDQGSTSHLGLAAVVIVAAFTPLAFILFDWIDRQNSLRLLSGASGGLIAALGGGVLSLVGVGIISTAMLGCDWCDETANGPLNALLLGIVLTIWWIRAVHLRTLLFEHRPRELLFGALPPNKFWVRMAALFGLPSTMWTRSSLERPALWAFLLSRPLVYLGASLAKSHMLLLASLLIGLGHYAFAGGKKLAAQSIWTPSRENDKRAPILFLRSFEDDQFDFKRPWWKFWLRWFDLWSFRRNADEVMVDELGFYGSVVALGQPGEQEAPFGAMRHYSSHNDWQSVVTDAARRAQAIILVAGESPGLRWEFDLLHREHLVNRTILLLHPDPTRDVANHRAIAWLTRDETWLSRLNLPRSVRPVALLQSSSGPYLLTADKPSAATYVVALRAHFQQCSIDTLERV